MTTIPSYGKIWALGHPLTKPMVGREVVIEEKVDGSQFSAMVDHNGKLHMRSKGAEIHFGNVQDLFQPTVDHFVSQSMSGRMVPGVIYRGEAMKSERHNTLRYSRVPRGHLVLFDVDGGGQAYVGVEERSDHANAIKVEPVPVLFRGVLESEEQVMELLKRESFLGGALVEGVVIKPLVPDYYPADGKRIAAKFVSEAFKETHRKTWVPDKPERGDVVARVVEQVSGPARWEKAIQRLREAGELTDSPKDIGGIMKLVQNDVDEECREDIRDILYQAFRKEILRQSTSAIPAWYKQRLAASAFE